jgi:hypothetical protein
MLSFFVQHEDIDEAELAEILQMINNNDQAQ